jgi:peptidoglycan/xylan/chitin deacetylase (PgdA/CDA1 family)
VITFDDGRLSDYDVAFPLLAQAGARAEFFINTANIGRPGFMTWAHVEEMQRAGMSFQSHSHDHIVLLGLARPRLEYQLHTSKQRLEDRLGRAAQFVAAPYGLLDRHMIETAEQVGYQGVCNSRQWLAQPDHRVINRVAVHAHTTGTQFNGLVTARPAAYLRGYGRMALAQVPKRVLLKLRPSLLGVALAPEGA